MKKKELFALRKECVKKFHSLEDLLNFLGGLIQSEAQFPLVVGYESFDPRKEWQVILLSPKTEDDKLTLESYLSGLRNLKALKLENFKGGAVYNGVNSLREERAMILHVNVQAANSHGYSLNINFQEGRTYSVVSKPRQTNFDAVMGKHLGPNREM